MVPNLMLFWGWDELGYVCSHRNSLARAQLVLSER